MVASSSRQCRPDTATFGDAAARNTGFGGARLCSEGGVATRICTARSASTISCLGMVIRSLWVKAFVTLLAVAAVVWLYEATMSDSRFALPDPLPAARGEAAARLAPGQRLTFRATAYCKGEVTATGVAPKAGVAASDPSLLPLGSVVEIDAGSDRYNGIYTVLDTGPKIVRREVDLYIWSCNEALQFGTRDVQLTVLRLGWDPGSSSSSLPSRP